MYPYQAPKPSDARARNSGPYCVLPRDVCGPFRYLLYSTLLPYLALSEAAQRGRANDFGTPPGEGSRGATPAIPNQIPFTLEAELSRNKTLFSACSESRAIGRPARLALCSSLSSRVHSRPLSPSCLARMPLTIQVNAATRKTCAIKIQAGWRASLESGQIHFCNKRKETLFVRRPMEPGLLGGTRPTEPTENMLVSTVCPRLARQEMTEQVYLCE
jgi:hypothetical protein